MDFVHTYKPLKCQNFASQSGYATASWSKHFATQNGLRPPRFLRGAYFAVHWSELCFAKLPTAAAFIFAVHWSELCFAKRSATAPFSSGFIIDRNFKKSPKENFLR